MKEAWLTSLLIISFSVAAAHGGHADLPDASETPGSALYSLDLLMEKVSLAITFDKKKKALKRMDFAQERLSEALVLSKRNRSEAAGHALENYRKHMERVEEIFRELSGPERKELDQHINESREVRKTVLEGLSRKLPEAAAPGLQKALENMESKRGEQSQRRNKQKRGKPEKSSTGFIGTGTVVRTR